MHNQKPKILIVGMFHMGANTDMIQTDIGNVIVSEVEQVIQKLKAFKPNRVAVEVLKEKDAELNEAYQQYINNSLELGKSEVYQIGFRLSAEMGNEKIYPIDWMGDIGQRSIGEVLEWAKTNQPQQYRLITEEYIPKLIAQSSGLTILEKLVNINQQERLQFDHELYMQVARIGEGTDYIGIDWMRWWYQRNLIIYSNLSRLVHDSNDRILLLIGAAHVHLVSQFLEESRLVEVESAWHYLQ
ncbi:DUF5694 domain-containing protein [Psychrobacillus sp. NPDC096426]|uniref:DUF5694 domain-containing protein n=1 Tax=Psychrobacillus sp. NPDC096426 TaxID=3364491 RepID=UPI0037F72F72